jgi:hypothetical protein
VLGTEVVTPFDLDPGLRQALHRFAVGDARERACHRLELRRVAIELRQFSLAPIEHPSDEPLHELLGQIAEPRELEKGHFGLDHPELRQMASGLGLLGPKGGAEAVHLAEGSRRRFEVELPRLTQVRLVAEVLGLEESGRPLARGRCQYRRVDQDVVPLVEEISDRLNDLVSNA